MLFGDYTPAFRVNYSIARGQGDKTLVLANGAEIGFVRRVGPGFIGHRIIDDGFEPVWVGPCHPTVEPAAGDVIRHFESGDDMSAPKHTRKENSMSSEIQQTLTIESIERLRRSANGNPRFRVTFTNGLVAQTATDSMVAYALDNSDYLGVPLTVTFTKSGRICDVSVIKES